MTVPFGQRQLELGGKYLDTDLRESNDALENPQALRDRMNQDGYLLIRGLYDHAQVLAARAALLKKLDAAGQIEPGTNLDDAIARKDKQKKNPSAMQTDLTGTPEFRALVESPRVMAFFDRFLGGKAMTFDFKWLRTVGPGAGTGVHYDIVYMGRGTQKLYTTWTPLGDTPIAMGTLAVCKGSHRFEKIKETYGRMDVDRDLVAGWFSNDPVEIVDKFGGKWATTDFRAGDALIFGMYTMHASLKNTTDRLRLSCDTRFQLASDPVDDRWVGPNPKAHYAWGKDPAKEIPMDKAREKWGV